MKRSPMKRSPMKWLLCLLAVAVASCSGQEHNPEPPPPVGPTEPFPAPELTTSNLGGASTTGSTTGEPAALSRNQVTGGRGGGGMGGSAGVSGTVALDETRTPAAISGSRTKEAGLGGVAGVGGLPGPHRGAGGSTGRIY